MVFIFIFYKHRRTISLEACCQWALLSHLRCNLLHYCFTSTLRKYMYPSVIMWMIILEHLAHLESTGAERTFSYDNFPFWLPTYEGQLKSHVTSEVRRKSHRGSNTNSGLWGECTPMFESS